MGPQRGAEVSVPLLQFAACRVVKKYPFTARKREIEHDMCMCMCSSMPSSCQHCSAALQSAGESNTSAKKITFCDLFQGMSSFPTLDRGVVLRCEIVKAVQAPTAP